MNMDYNSIKKKDLLDSFSLENSRQAKGGFKSEWM